MLAACDLSLRSSIWPGTAGRFQGFAGALRTATRRQQGVRYGCAGTGESGLASCKAVADLVTRHHSALQYIYCLELVLQVRKRTTVDQAGSRMQWTWTQLWTRR